jgi:hypothetical protein
MMCVLIFTAVGILIGWNLPQPVWAKQAQDKAVEAVRGIAGKPKS